MYFPEWSINDWWSTFWLVEAASGHNFFSFFVVNVISTENFDLKAGCAQAQGTLNLLMHQDRRKKKKPRCLNKNEWKSSSVYKSKISGVLWGECESKNFLANRAQTTSQRAQTNSQCKFFLSIQTNPAVGTHVLLSVLNILTALWSLICDSWENPMTLLFSWPLLDDVCMGAAVITASFLPFLLSASYLGSNSLLRWILLNWENDSAVPM